MNRINPEKVGEIIGALIRYGVIVALFVWAVKVLA